MSVAVRAVEVGVVALAAVVVWTVLALVVWATVASLVKRGGRR